MPGVEGTGVVEESGGSRLADSLVKENVAFICNPLSGKGSGSWGEYAIVEANHCIILSIDLKLHTSFILNPLTAYAMVDQVSKAIHPCMVITAAMSSIGRHAAHLARGKGIKVI